MITVIGHKNPDTDAVVSAMVYSRILREEGKDARPAIAGEINRETEFVLSFLKEEPPQRMDSVEGEVFLVDHNEMAQSVTEEGNVCGVLDHHRIAGICTDNPIFFRVEPVGSTSTLVYKVIKERGGDIRKKEASLLLAGIISDTLNLTSSTTTSEDKEALLELSDIAEIEVNDLAERMFEAKSDLSGKSMREIITGDGKEYQFNGKRVYIGWWEVTSLNFFDENKYSLLNALQEFKEEEGVDHLFFGAVDIRKGDTRLYFADDEDRGLAEEAFKGKEDDGFFFLEGVTSRKKQVAPPLSEIIK